jgi:hypothetical protein
MPSGSEQQQRAGEKVLLSSPSVKRIDILRRDQANRKRAPPGRANCDFLVRRQVNPVGWRERVCARMKATILYRLRPQRFNSRVNCFRRVMPHTSSSEVDIEQLMAEIRSAVAKREASGKLSVLGADLELRKLLSNPIGFRGELKKLPFLSLQPDFVPREDNHYHVNDLLKYHDHAFIWNAYRAILKREPDEPGLQFFLARLRSGRFNKIDLLGSLLRSQEAKSKNVRVDGLKARAVLRRLYRLPFIGYALEMVAAVFRLPALIRYQRQFEAYTVAQTDLLANHLNQMGANTFREIESISNELAEVSAEQRKFAEVQRQQISDIFRRQQQLAGHLKKAWAETESADGHPQLIESGNPESENALSGVTRETL